MVKLREGYVFCPRGGGSKGPCGVTQRLPKSVSNCDYCGKGAKSKPSASINPTSNETDSEVSDAVVKTDGSISFGHLYKRDRIQAMEEEIKQGIKNLTYDEKALIKYLDFQRESYSYSLNNSMLLFFQKPYATNCKTLKQWDALGYKVAKGKKGAFLYRPFFKKKEDDRPTAYDDDKKDNMEIAGYTSYPVFDVKDLDSSVKKPPVHPIEAHLEEYRQKDIPDNEIMRNDLEKTAELMGVKISYENFRETGSRPEEIDGYARKAKNDDKYKYEIVINSNQKEHAQTYTLAHEMSHISLGHLEPDNIKKYNNIGGEGDKDRGDFECEAEMMAYSIARGYGLDTGNSGYAYILSWSKGDTDKIKKALDGVSKGLVKYYNNLEKSLTGKSKEDVNQEARTKVKEKSDKRRT